MRLVVASIVAASALVGFASPAGAVPVPWKNCGKAGDIVSVQKFDASTWPPQRGRSLTITVNLTVGKDVARGASDLRTFSPKSGKSLLKEFLIPQNVRGRGLKAGPVQVNKTFTVPRLPSGSVYTLHRDVRTVDGAGVICVDLTVPIK